MRERLQEEIESYEKRVAYLKQMHSEANDNLTKVRLAAKQGVYTDIIRDLKRILEDAKDPA
jgi:hypothetical protein